MLYCGVPVTTHPLTCLLAITFGFGLGHSSSLLAADLRSASPLRFSVSEGRVHNEFFRDGHIAAHLVLTSGPSPRLVVASPAGNSGTALWFDAASGSFAWLPEAELTGAHRNVKEGTLRGISAELEASGAPITIRHAILSSVRVIRDYGYTGETPAEVMVPPQVKAKAITWQRPRLDGEAGYYLSIELLRGSISGDSENIRLLPDADGRLRLRVTALTGEEPLAPIVEDELLTSAAQPDERLRQILAFLAYEGKLLAGSWRFNTYFGRDTLMSLELLMPVLKAAPVEAGLGAVLERLNAAGEVAHEEDIGEYAVLRHLREDDRASGEPIYDYKMIDDDFLLPIVAARYLLATSTGRERAADFLARRTSSGETYGAALMRNLRFVLSVASAFAENPEWPNLVALRPGVNVGNWRDSEDGLGGGRFPYDVNGVFVPAALAAIAEFHESGILDDYIPRDTGAAISDAARMASTWQRHASRYFEVTFAADVARAETAEYARRIGVPPDAALKALGDDPVTFHAVAIDETGAPVPILNSDEGFALLFLDPPSAKVERIVETLVRPFPAGLMTDVGPVVANPAYADDELEPLFGRSRYHGTVIWSWQQAMLAAGIARQLEREDLAASARNALARARTCLDSVIARISTVRGSELWSWSENDGRFEMEPFGQRSGDETESNAAQLWSTVYLARPTEAARQAKETGNACLTTS
jgi:glycogen debranching enzyme